MTKRLPIDFDGEWIELRGFLRTEDVSGYTGLWMREDGVAVDRLLVTRQLDFAPED